MKFFIGRKIELQKLKDLYDRRTSSLVVVKGRRRIGKSYLISQFSKEYCSHKKFFSFTGLAPTKGITAQDQRDHFSQQLANILQKDSIEFEDWTEAFSHLSQHISDGDIILLDEISWMGAKDSSFIPKLKAWWDKMILKETHIFLVFCGSVSTWIEENILNSTAFFGRISLNLTLSPFSIPESAKFLKALGFKGSPLEVYKLLSVLGGVPWYLEHIHSKAMADENIKNFCFDKDGLLVSEFDRIFHDLFNGKGHTYKKILDVLKKGMKTLSDIRKEINFSRSGTLSILMKHLIICGFIKEHPIWSLRTNKLFKQSLFRIDDPYIRFYLKNIEPNRSRILLGNFDALNVSELPGFDSYIGLQVEYLLLQNRALLLKSLGINPIECLFDGPYRQTKTARIKGCQIDYLVQTRTKNLFVCEFKFKRRELDIEIIQEVEQKIKRISVPRGYALVPVLFHIGGVSEAVYDRNYFYRIIDIIDFLDGEI